MPVQKQILTHKAALFTCQISTFPPKLSSWDIISLHPKVADSSSNFKFLTMDHPALSLCHKL